MMNAQFQVAQATSTAVSTGTAKPRIFKLTKPLTDQAVVINVGYDQKVQIDFSSIANEKITLVHVGEKLIILFDNQSTVTVEPFFDSRADALQNLSIEMAPGRIVSVNEFASLFPITTDQSVLPAAGTEGGNAQASGANFSPFTVDPLPPVPTNVLAPQEELGTFQIQLPTGVAPETIAPAPTISAGPVPGLAVDESFIPVIGSQQAPAGSNVDTAAFASAFTVDAPAGVQSVTYALTINNANTNLIDSISGQQVLLSLNGAGGVEGRTAIGGDLVFTLTVDGAGNVTFTELRAVQEGTPGDFNEGISLAAGLVSLTATVTDVNNVSVSASIDLGPQITINDDGPIGNAPTAAPVLDDDAQTLFAGNPGDAPGGSGDVADATIASGVAGSLFTAGADGLQSVSFADPVGLMAIYEDSNGFAVQETLTYATTVVAGHTILTATGATSTNTVFTLDVAPDGSYTFTALKPLVSPTVSGTVEETQDVVINFTVTDGDTDTATGSLTINVNDDTPVGYVVTNATVTDDDVQTEFPGNTGGTGDVADISTASGIAGTLFTAGADGLKSISFTAPVISTVYKDPATGFALTESVSWATTTSAGGVTTYTGTSANNGIVATLVVNADGSYTFTQSAPLVHPTSSTTEENLPVVFAFTVTDGDTDTATGSLTINVNDDTPVANTVTATPVLDDEAQTLFSPNLGGSGDVSPDLKVATGDAGSLFTAGADGLKSISFTPDPALKAIWMDGNGHPVQEFLIYTPTTTAAGHTILTATGATSSNTVFVLDVAPDGSYTFTVSEPLVHPTNSTTEENLGVVIGFTVTDGDGDPATGSLTINANDDTPEAAVPDYAVLSNGAGLPFTFGLDLDNTLSDNYGADGGTVRFPASLDNTLSGLTSNGVPIIYDVSLGGLTLTGFAGLTPVFVIILDPVTGTYSVDMNATVDSTTVIDFSGGGYDFVGGNDEWAAFIPVGGLGAALLLTPEINNNWDGSINTSALSGGVSDAASIGAAETFRIDFVMDLSGDPNSTGGGDYDTQSKRDHIFANHYLTNGAAATFTASSGSTVKFSAYQDPDGDNVGGFSVVGANGADPGQQIVTGVAIEFNGQTTFIDLTAGVYNNTVVIVGGHNFTITEQLDGSVDIGGVYGDNNNSTTVAVFTQNQYNALEYTWVAGDTFKIGDFSAAVPTTNPISFDVPIEVVDGDGDTAASVIGITLTEPGGSIQDYSHDSAVAIHTYSSTGLAPHIIGSDYADTLTGDGAINVLSGGRGADTINGAGGNDVLIGGDGIDSLTGGTGADQFLYNARTDGLDHIVDFSGHGGQLDVLVFDSAAFGNLAAGTLTPANFASNASGTATAATAQFVYNETTDTLSYDSDGTGAAAAIAMAVLENGFALNNTDIRIV